MRVIAFVVVLSLALLSTAALAEVPGQMNYQGTLTDSNGVAVDDIVSMTFRIYADSTGGSALWSETQSSVEVSDGIFNVLLGRVNALSDMVFQNPTRWLGITLFDDPEMQPRQRIAAVGYAFRAAEADTADHVRGGGAGSDGDWTIVGNNMYSAVSGRVGIGTVSPQEKFHVADGNLIVGGLGVNNRIKGTSGDASIVAELFAYDGLGGYVGTFTDHKFVLRTNDLDRVTIDTGGKVGIGTSTPQVKLSLGTDLTAKKLALWDGVDDFYGLGVELGRMTFYTNNTEKMTIYNNGRVGIGTTTPAAKLAVRNEAVADINVNSDTSYAVIRLRQNGIDKWAWAGEWLSNRTSIFSYDLAANVLVIENTGEVGIGTETPSEELHVVGTIKSVSSDGRAIDGLTTSSNEWVPCVYGRNEGAGDGVYGWSQSRHGTFGITFSSNTNHAGVYGKHDNDGPGVYGESEAGEGVKGKATGNGFGGWFRADGNTGTGVHASCLGTSGIGIYAEGGTSGLAGLFRGNVRIASKSTGTTIIELGEGLDYAEGFDVTDVQQIGPGSVLVIDSENPGKLRSCDSPYDSKVAGIVAGGRGQGSGVRLGPEEFDHNVALAGRVYCNVDATYGPVLPGDLLTTSQTPGYAMAVKDHVRAPGAVLGKAMEGLPEGDKGQILVLVTLQ